MKQNVSAEIPLQPRTQIQIFNVQKVMAVGVDLYILENSYRRYISKQIHNFHQQTSYSLDFIFISYLANSEKNIRILHSYLVIFAYLSFPFYFALNSIHNYVNYYEILEAV